jgi:hypothetical protein
MTHYLLIAAVAVLPLSACTMTGESARKPLPSLTEQFVQPFHVNASNIIVESRYDPLANAKDVSSTFPTPPDLALKRYAETRLRSAGGQGVLRFIIEDASVFQEGRQSPSEVARWLNVDNKDRYVAMIKIALIREGVSAMAPGAQGSTMRVERTLTIPESSSLAERDRLLQGLMSQILGDIDKAVIDALTNTLHLSAEDIAPSPGPWPVEPVDITPQDMNP